MTSVPENSEPTVNPQGPGTAVQGQTSKPAPKPAPQSGILNRPTEHLLLAALNLTGPNPRQTIEELRALVRGELTSQIAPNGDPSAAAPETGELGFAPHHDRAHLTITVGFAASGYDKLTVSPTDRPADLTPIPWAQLGDTPENSSSGDLVLQICADNAFIAEHVLRRIEHTLTGQVQVVWAHTGAQRYTSRPGRVSKHEGRGWIGFLDGTSNLDPGKNDDDYALTFVDPDTTGSYPALPQPGQPNPYGTDQGPTFPPDLRPFDGTEPGWTRNGSYLTVRVSTTDLATWDSEPRTTQEQIIGRHKVDGVSLDLDDTPGQDDQTPPNFALNPADLRVAIDAHIRKANPRAPQDASRSIFRRGYPLYEGGDGTVRRGLIFLAYARTITTQFEFVFRGWLTNPNFPQPNAGVDRLRAFDTHVLAGGYYFVPPLEQPRRPWSWHVPAAVTS